MAGGRTITPPNVLGVPPISSGKRDFVKPEGSSPSENSNDTNDVSMPDASMPDASITDAGPNIFALDAENAAKVAAILADLTTNPSSHPISDLSLALHCFSHRIGPEKDGRFLNTIVENPPNLDEHKRGVDEKAASRMRKWRATLKV